MLFRIIKKEELRKLFDVIAVNTVVGPVKKGVDRNGKEIFSFEVVYDFDEMDLDYSTTHVSPKRFYLPYNEKLCSFKVNPDGWEKHVDYNIYKPFVLFGLHACDINALNKLDKVLLQGAYPFPYYGAKRRNMFIVGLDCTPQPYCFCQSMGADSVLHGFDLFLTDIGDEYFVEILSAPAFNFIQEITSRQPSEDDHSRYQQTVADRNKRFMTHVDTTDLTKILDMEFQSDVWQEWGDQCLSCGSCAQVCPTCYCYGVEEEVDLDLQGGLKLKQLYSCNLVDFAEVAGGHNFRSESASRIKYRYYHKHRGFVEAFEESLCVGCGRCGQTCLAGITVPDVINSVRGGGK